MRPAVITWSDARSQPIAKDALTILVNISHDTEILKALYDDEAFLETLILKLTVRKSA